MKGNTKSESGVRVVSLLLAVVLLSSCPMPLSTGLLEEVKHRVDEHNQQAQPDIMILQNGVEIPDGTGSYVFLNAVEGSYEDVTFTIENFGGADLHLESTPITISGDHASMFTVNVLPTSNTVVPTQNVSFTIRFAPTGGAGTKTAAIGIISDDSDENPYDFSVRGTIGPEIDIKVGNTDILKNGSHDFTPSGPVVLDNSVDVVFTISNPGTANLLLSGAPMSVILAGPDAGQFSVTSQPVSPVPAKASTTFTVRFLAEKLAFSEATVTIANSDPDENPYSFIITASARLETRVIKLAGGGRRTVALKADGTVWAWGNYTGDGTTTNRLAPVQIGGLTGVVAVAAGYTHTVVLKTDGTVWAWGYNGWGALGDNSTTTRLTPVQVSSLTAVAAIAAGYYYTLALKSDGTVWAWGLNDHGQLGDGTTAQRLTPVPVSGLTGVAAIAAGESHSVALKTDGSVWAWGGNSNCQLGDGTTTQRLTAVSVSGLTTGVTAIAAGEGHTVALKTDGAVWAWGWNLNGQLGDGTTAQRLTPVSVSGLTTGVTAIGAGYSYSVARKSDGAVLAWGDNTYGQLGDGTTAQRLTPVSVSGLTTGVTDLGAGYFHTVVLKTDGTVWAWGFNDCGQTGDGTTTQRPTAVQVSGLAGISRIDAGEYHTVALKTDASVWAWGANSLGQLGDGTTTQRLTPVPVITGAAAIAASWYHTVALKSDGSVWSWGNNDRGQLGDGTTTRRLAPVPVSGLTTGVAAIAAGFGYSVALKSGGTVCAWGENIYGQLGDGTTTQRLTPVTVSGLTDVVAIAAGWGHTVALKTNGSVWAWGRNDYGQLGDGTTTQRLTPVPVSGLNTGVKAIAAGASHTVVLKTDGTVWTWGQNLNGQIGDSTTTQRLTPVPVSGLAAVAAIAAGYFHTVALKTDGSVLAWGWNQEGQLGDGTTTQRLAPVMVSGIQGVAAIEAGYLHTVALKADSTIWAWGYNYYGELGDSSTSQRLIPVRGGIMPLLLN